MRLPLQLEPETLQALTTLVGHLKHDLGRYVALHGRWLAPDASPSDRLAALTDDLLHTRRGPDGSTDAVAVWTPFARVLSGQEPLQGAAFLDLREDPDVARLFAGMDRIGQRIAALRAGQLDAASIDPTLAAARDVAGACRDLHRRVRDVSTLDG